MKSGIEKYKIAANRGHPMFTIKSERGYQEKRGWFYF